MCVCFRPLGELKALWDGRRCRPSTDFNTHSTFAPPLPLLSDPVLTRPQAWFREGGAENLSWSLASP